MIQCDCGYLETFGCLDCAACTNCNYEYYMVTDEVWLTAHPEDNGMLCIGCLEQRLGRTLGYADFTGAPINAIGLMTGSPRYQDRLTNVTVQL
jgi:formate-dependent nitrite reductase cytochrome c552 subunit